jgi:hypothetical protein
MYEMFNSSFSILKNEIAKNIYSNITKSWVQNELLKPHIELERDKYFPSFKSPISRGKQISLLLTKFWKFGKVCLIIKYIKVYL